MTCCNPPSCESRCWFPCRLVDRHCAKLVDCTLMIQSTAIHSPGCTSHLLSTTNTHPQQRSVVILSLCEFALSIPPYIPSGFSTDFPVNPVNVPQTITLNLKRSQRHGGKTKAPSVSHNPAVLSPRNVRHGIQYFFQ